MVQLTLKPIEKGTAVADNSTRTMKILVLVMTVAFVLSTLLFGVYLGFDLSKKLQRENSAQSRFVRKAIRGFGAAFLQGRPKQVTIQTNRLNLIFTEYFVPLELKNGAGGISNDPVGGVLIVDLAGKVFRFWEERIERLDITTPNSNVETLKRQLNDGVLGNVEINFGHFRYNDILVHTSGDGASLLVSYSEWHSEKRCFTSTLAKVPLPSGDPSEWIIAEEDWTIVTRTRPCLPLYESGFGIKGAEAGGRIISRSDTEVFWTSGIYNRDDNFDKSYPEVSLSQDDQTDYGKVMLVDIEQRTVRIFAKGLRNPQGIDVDGLGNILVTDHGMRGGDELNLGRDGSNFGYPLVTLGTKYSKQPGGLESFHTGHSGFDKPIVAFVPAIAPSSVLYVKNFHPNWDGSILVGGLKRHLHHVYVEEGEVLFVEPIDVGYKIRDMVRARDGKIVIFTNDNKLVFMEPESASLQYERFKMLLAKETDLELRDTTQDMFDGCLVCHGLAENEPGTGPTLFGICGRKPGTENFAEYSGTLSQTFDIWDHDNLVRFVSDPEGTAPGTTMAWGGIGRLEVAELLVKNLCQL